MSGGAHERIAAGSIIIVYLDAFLQVCYPLLMLS